MSPAALALQGVSKSFGGVRALKAVDLEVEAGTIVALMGENGAGKSTLGNIACGVIRPDSGRVLVDGEPTVFHRPSDADRVGIHLVPQELSLCPELSVAENVCMGGIPTRWGTVVDRRRLRRMTDERLALLAVTDIAPDRPVGSLPVVAQEFVQIARALAPGTRVLVVDEPTGPMSGAEVDQFMGMVRVIADAGVGVVFVSHRLDEVVRICDRAVVLRDGELVAELGRSAMTRTVLASAMVGDPATLDVDRPPGPGAGSATMLAVDDLRSGRLLRGVSLEVRAGDLVTLYGGAGSGREAVAGAIVGALPVEQGTVTVAGRRLRRRSIRNAIGAGIGYVPAERRSQGLMLASSVRANLTLATLALVAVRGLLSRRRERSFCRPWIARLNIGTPSPDAPVGTLSGGNQQKVLLARWLATDCRVLVLEEPTRGVDIAAKAEIWRLLRQKAEEGMAVLVVTSDSEEAAVVGNRALVMRHGRVVAEMASPSEHELVVAAMGEEGKA